MSTPAALAALGRVRVALALALLGLAGVAQQLAILEEDLVVRLLAAGLLFGAAAIAGELAARTEWRRVAVVGGPVAEFWAAAVTVALLERYSDVAPALLLLPIATLGLVFRLADVLAFAALAGALVVEARVLRSPPFEDAVLVAGWAVVYMAWAVVAARAGGALRRATARRESAERSLPTLAAASSYDEIARIVFGYLDAASDTSDAPAALLVDDDGGGTMFAVAARAVAPELRARLRARTDRSALPSPFDRGLVVRLGDGARTIGLVLVAGARVPPSIVERVRALAEAAVLRVRAATRARRVVPPRDADAKAWLTRAARGALGGAESRVARARDAGDAFRDIVTAARRARIAVVGDRAAVQVGGDDLWLLVRRERPLDAGERQLLVALTDEAARLRERADAESRVARLAARIGSDGSETAARLVDALRVALEASQPHLHGSGERVAAVAGVIAERLGHPASERQALQIAALLRDVGELGIDRAVLDRPAELSATEREVIERHPLLGEAILRTVPALAVAARIVRAHHEHWDGTGYPDRLRGEDIPRGARVLAVADAYVALTAPRAHRAALRPSEALGVLLEGRGSGFEPDAVDALVTLAGTGVLALP